MAIPALSRSFKGVDLQGLTVKETICEYRADVVDGSEKLVDISSENQFACKSRVYKEAGAQVVAASTHAPLSQVSRRRAPSASPARSPSS